MKLIIGLGNPGHKYENNRHNLGFMVADAFSVEQGVAFRVSADLMCDFAKANNFIVAKPKTFMNQSGEAVRAISNYFQIDSKEILVVHDDLDLEFGKLRVAFDGMSAGNRGVDSVIKSLGTMEFARLRIGIGLPKNSKQDPADFVLEDFDQEEKKNLPQVIEKAVEAVKSYIDGGIEVTMNRFN